MAYSSRFISIEGGEGVGKTHLVQGLRARLEELGNTVLLTREPGGTPLATAVRELFLNPPAGERLTPEAELFLVSAARAQHVARVIKPSLLAGQWVICDRYYDSTRVYQGTLGGVPSADLENVVSYSIAGCHPELTFLLDCPVEVSLERVAKRAEAEGRSTGNRYDQGARSMHESLRQAYLDLHARFPDRILRIDASSTPDQVLTQAWSQLKQHYRL